MALMTIVVQLNIKLEPANSTNHSAKVETPAPTAHEAEKLHTDFVAYATKYSKENR